MQSTVWLWPCDVTILPGQFCLYFVSREWGLRNWCWGSWGDPVCPFFLPSSPSQRLKQAQIVSFHLVWIKHSLASCHGSKLKLNSYQQNIKHWNTQFLLLLCHKKIRMAISRKIRWWQKDQIFDAVLDFRKTANNAMYWKRILTYRDHKVFQCSLQPCFCPYERQNAPQWYLTLDQYMKT